MPQQLAIGVSDAAGQLVHGLRASLENSRDHILFVLDAKDAFQTVKRSIVLERMSKITGLEAQTTFWHARHNARPMLLVGPLRNRLFDNDDTRGDSEEGVMQGAPDSPAVFCVATQDELVSLDNAVAMEGGTARAFMDDVALVASWRHRKPDSWRSRSTSRTLDARPADASRRSRYTRLGSTPRLSRQAHTAARQRECAV